MGIPQSQIVNLNKSRERAKYWRTDSQGNWVETALLPADPMSIQYYFSKGFKGKCPTGEVQEEVSSEGVQCPLCEFKAKDAFGLAAHLRKHTRKSNKEEKA